MGLLHRDGPRGRRIRRSAGRGVRKIAVASVLGFRVAKVAIALFVIAVIAVTVFAVVASRRAQDKIAQQSEELEKLKQFKTGWENHVENMRRRILNCALEGTQRCGRRRYRPGRIHGPCAEPADIPVRPCEGQVQVLPLGARQLARHGQIESGQTRRGSEGIVLGRGQGCVFGRRWFCRTRMAGGRA